MYPLIIINIALFSDNLETQSHGMCFFFIVLSIRGQMMTWTIFVIFYVFFFVFGKSNNLERMPISFSMVYTHSLISNSEKGSGGREKEKNLFQFQLLIFSMKEENERKKDEEEKKKTKFSSFFFNFIFFFR